MTTFLHGTKCASFPSHVPFDAALAEEEHNT